MKFVQEKRELTRLFIIIIYTFNKNIEHLADKLDYYPLIIFSRLVDKNSEGERDVRKR